MNDEYVSKNRDRYVHLGIAIAALRKMRGLSQEQLAEKANVSRHFYRNFNRFSFTMLNSNSVNCIRRIFMNITNFWHCINRKRNSGSTFSHITAICIQNYTCLC